MENTKLKERHTMTAKTKKKIKLDPAYVKHSVASEVDMKVPHGK